ncbi:MAG TPA: class I SAM-dependent methyltransferase [Candidatus Angelobacter sp.]
MASTEKQSQAGLLLVWPILTQMKNIEGWLGEDEADLLMAAATRVITKLPKSHAVVEVGSYCGRATFVLASVAKALRPETKIYAIDPHDGKVGALDQGIQSMPPSLEKLKKNLAGAGLTDSVVILPSHSWEVAWDKPIGLLFIDALHDYANVSRDFYHFEPWLAPGAYVAFHDYADYYPGVKTFVNEILATGQYEKVHCASSMMVMRKITERAPALPKKTGKSAK